MSASLPPHATLRYDLVRRRLSRLPGIESVLEVGPGQGALEARLARPCRQVDVEPDPEASAVTRARVPEQQIFVRFGVPEVQAFAVVLLYAFAITTSLPGGFILLRRSARPTAFAH